MGMNKLLSYNTNADRDGKQAIYLYDTYIYVIACYLNRSSKIVMAWDTICSQNISTQIHMITLHITLHWLPSEGKGYVSNL